MFMLLITSVIFLLIYKFYKFAYYKPPNSPPSIPREPISGSYLLLLLGSYSFPHKTVEYFAKKFRSKIVGFYMGDFWTVAANDYASIKEVLTREEFDGRLTNIPAMMDRAFGKNLGITFTDGPFWKEQRKYFLQNIRDFGFGRRHETFEKETLDEMSLFIDILKNGPVYDREKKVMRGNLLLFPDILYPTVCSPLWKVLFGQRFDRSEYDIPGEICSLAMMFVQSLDSMGGAMSFFPFLRHFGNMFGFKNMIKGQHGVANIIREYIKYQKDTLDENVDRGLVDRYLKVLKKDNTSQSFSEDQMVTTLTEATLATCSTIPTFTSHTIRYLINNPRILEKMQEEINRVVGTSRLVTWNDRKNLPYTEAVIREVLRITSSLPLSFFHRTVKDTTLGGYAIPANTAIITNFAAMHHDPDLWGDPENFRPERFINENGGLVQDKSLPFGLGHHVCPGEFYSRYTLFEILTVLLQNFNFYQVEGEPSTPGNDLPGLLITPKKFWIRYELR